VNVPDLLDPAAMERLYRLGGPKLVGKMINAFLSGARTRLAGAAAGLATGDLAPVRFAMHSLRGTAGNFGASTVPSLAQGLETAAVAGDMEAVVSGMPALEAAFAALADRLLLERERGRS